MTTTIEYALMAGGSYISTRPEINRFPAPQNWNEITELRKNDPSSGFEATTFQNSTDIVISYAGTNGDGGGIFTNPDLQAAVGLALGTGGSAQLLQAVEYYLQVKAAHTVNGVAPNITLTGHSLGGGLAALVGVFFGVEAHTFDQAPFAQTALFKAADLKAELVSKGLDAELAPLTSYLAQQDAALHPHSTIPNANLVTNISVQGEFLSSVPWNILNRIGATTEVISNSGTGVAGDDLHAQALLAAVLQSRQTAASGEALNDVTAKLPDLLKMIFDNALFAHSTARTNVTDVNFLEHLVRHEAGNVAGVAANGDAKGYTRYFVSYLATLPQTERLFITQQLFDLRDWYIQAGTDAMVATAGAQRAFLLSGNGNDTLTGNAQADVLVGGAGADTLTGNAGNDLVKGGAGDDTLYGEGVTRSGYRQINLFPRARCQRNQHIQTEFIPLAARQIRNAGLRDTQHLSRLSLRPLALVDGFPQENHQFGTHRQDRRFIRRKSQINEDIAAGSVDFFRTHGSFSNHFVAFGGQIDICPGGFGRLLLEGMQHINRLGELGDIQHPPLAQRMHTNLIHARANRQQRFEITGHQSILHLPQLHARRQAHLTGKARQIILAATDKTKRFHHSDYITTFIMNAMAPPTPLPWQRGDKRTHASNNDENWRIAA